MRTLKDGVSAPGYYHMMWDGKDNTGRKAPAGIYFVRFSADDYNKVKKAVFLR